MTPACATGSTSSSCITATRGLSTSGTGGCSRTASPPTVGSTTATSAGKLTGASTIADFCRKALEGLDATQHLIGNTMIDLDGDRATSTCYFQAQHVFVGDKGGDTYIVAGTYHDVLERQRGTWRIAHRTLTPTWLQGNPDVFAEGAARAATR